MSAPSRDGDRRVPLGQIVNSQVRFPCFLRYPLKVYQSDPSLISLDTRLSTGNSKTLNIVQLSEGSLIYSNGFHYYCNQPIDRQNMVDDLFSVSNIISKEFISYFVGKNFDADTSVSLMNFFLKSHLLKVS